MIVHNMPATLSPQLVVEGNSNTRFLFYLFIFHIAVVVTIY